MLDVDQLKLRACNISGVADDGGKTKDTLDKGSRKLDILDLVHIAIVLGCVEESLIDCDNTRSQCVLGKSPRKSEKQDALALGVYNGIVINDRAGCCSFFWHSVFPSF